MWKNKTFNHEVFNFQDKVFSPFPSPAIKHQTFGDMKVGSWLWRRVQIILLACRRTSRFTLKSTRLRGWSSTRIVCMLLPKLKWFYIMRIIFNFPFNMYSPWSGLLWRVLLFKKIQEKQKKEPRVFFSCVPQKMGKIFH